jgi:hypothetical protein
MRVPRLRAAILVSLVAALAFGGCRNVTPLPATALSDVASLDDFRASFNAGRDRARLLVLLSPT